MHAYTWRHPCGEQTKKIHSYCDHMKTSNPTEAENSTLGQQLFEEDRRKTAKNHNDRLDDVHVHSFELVTLHKLSSSYVFTCKPSTYPLFSFGLFPHHPVSQKEKTSTKNSDLCTSLYQQIKWLHQTMAQVKKFGLQRVNCQFALVGCSGSAGEKITVEGLNWHSFQVRG